RGPRSPARRSRDRRSPGRRTPAAAGSAAPRRAACRSGSRFEVVGVVREVLGAVLGDEHEVLEAAAAEAGVVEAGFDGDDVAGDERVTARHSHPRLLVHLQPDAVPEAVNEAVLEHLARLLAQRRAIAVLLEELARPDEDLAALDA